MILSPTGFSGCLAVGSSSSVTSLSWSCSTSHTSTVRSKKGFKYCASTVAAVDHLRVRSDYMIFLKIFLISPLKWLNDPFWMSLDFDDKAHSGFHRRLQMREPAWSKFRFSPKNLLCWVFPEKMTTQVVAGVNFATITAALRNSRRLPTTVTMHCRDLCTVDCTSLIWTVPV